MRFGMTNEIDWQYLGALLAQQTHIEQTKFLKSFVKECQSWGTHFQIEYQLSEINYHLTKEEREILSMITDECEKENQ